VARGDSTIRVNIIGDAKSLQKAAGKSEKAVGGIGKAAVAAGGLLAGAFAVDAVFDFGQSALNEVDRVGDATARLEAQLGDLSKPLIEAAGGMEELGQSRQDVLELEARFTDLATAAHLSAVEIAAGAPAAVEAAAALSLLGIGGGDAATVLDLIGKAASGSDKPLKELGISLSDAEVEARAMADTGKTNAEALTEQELSAARLALIMEKLQPRIVAVTEGTADLEQKQKELDARLETLTGNVGDAIDGPLTDFLTWLILTGEQADAGAKALDGVSDAFDNIGGAAQAQIDDLRELIALLAQVAQFFPGGSALGFASQSVGTGSRSGSGATVVVQGGSPEVIERAVRDAINHANGTGPLT
jgi:uncharacterized phage infection (PIP) family protein YhgE